MRFMVTGKGIKAQGQIGDTGRGRRRVTDRRGRVLMGLEKWPPADGRQSRKREKRKRGVFLFKRSLYPEGPLEI